MENYDYKDAQEAARRIAAMTPEELKAYAEHIAKKSRIATTPERVQMILQAIPNVVKEINAQQQSNYARFFAHLAENLALIATDLEIDLSNVHTIAFEPHLGGCGWWIDVNESTSDDGMYIWIERNKQGVCEIQIEGKYADCVYPQEVEA